MGLTQHIDGSKNKSMKPLDEYLQIKAQVYDIVTRAQLSQFEPYAPFGQYDTGHPALNLAYSLGEIAAPINTLIETGTHLGASTVQFAHVFDYVFTCEKYCAPNLQDNINYLKREVSPGVLLVEGDAPKCVKGILQMIPDTQTVCWLDAHNGTHEVPLLEELMMFSKYSNRRDHVFIIDDCQDMGIGNFPTFEQIQQEIWGINPEYNVVKSGYGRDIVYAYVQNDK